MTVIQFPRSHVRTSAMLMPKTAGAASRPVSRRALAKILNFSDGIRPRERQLETAGGFTPARSAAAEVPPTASITSSTVESIGLDNSHIVKVSSLHDTLIVTNCELRPNGPMRSLRDIAKRLEITQRALGKKAADIARETSITATEWSQYLNPDKYKRRITLEHAFELQDNYGATIQWIYDGDISTLPDGLSRKVRKLMAKAA